MRNTGLEEAQAGIKIAGRNTSHLRYGDDTTLMAESEEESEKAGLKLSIQKSENMAPSPITSWQIEGEKVGAVTVFLFLGSKITAAMKLKDACSLGEKL